MQRHLNLQTPKRISSVRRSTNSYKPRKSLTLRGFAARLNDIDIAYNWPDRGSSRVCRRSQGISFVGVLFSFPATWLAAVVCWMAMATAIPSASASCGDWLQHDSGPNASRAITSKSVAAIHLGERSPQRPCNGPHCGAAPNQPTAPGSTGIVLSTVKPALPDGLITVTASAHELRDAGDLNARPEEGFPRRIDHPPRSSRVLS
jgi:hypothetical protein